MSQVLDLWKKTRGIPVIGPWAFSFAFGQKAPYFATSVFSRARSSGCSVPLACRSFRWPSSTL